MSRIFPRAAALALSLLVMPVVAFAAAEYLTADSRSAVVAMFLNAAGLAVPVSPTAPMPVASKPATFTPLGCLPWQAITTASAVSLSAFSGGIPAGSTLVDIVPSVAVILRDDGSAPTTAGPGIPIQAGTIYPYSGPLSAAQLIAQTASGTVAVCFYK